jgi:nucleoside phosphorylase
MIKILVLDDNAEKAGHVCDVIRKMPEINFEDVKVARDLIQARDACRSTLFDLLILDLRLPNREGDPPDDNAGCEFVKELNASTTLLRPFHIIGLTAYDEALQSTDSFFEEELWRVIKYDSGVHNWRRQLFSKLQYLVSSKNAIRKVEETRHVYDLGIITALQTPEFESILDLPGNWQAVKLANDSTRYYKGFFHNSEKSLSVIAACAHQMGMPAAAVLASKVIAQFRPRYLAMTGVAAAVRGGHAKLGDILIADQSWDYTSGKYKIVADSQVFEPDPRSIPLSVDVKEALQNLQRKNAFLAEFDRDWRGARPEGPLRMHIGPVASGSAVVQDERIVEMIQAQSRKLIGLDMETYGVFFAAENCTRPRPSAISIKSACDFADMAKADETQAYAAFTSARYLYHFSLEYFEGTPIFR